MKKKTTENGGEFAVVNVRLSIPMNRADLADKALARDLVKTLPMTLGGVAVTAEVDERPKRQN